MIDFYISGQTIRFASPVIAANTLDYLEARFHFDGDDWDGCSKWAHFRQGSTVYDLNLEDDAISADMHLNLSIGAWETYVTGTLGESRLTTVPVILTVRESGLIDEPLHQIPQTVAEQIDNKATLALQKAAAVETAAAAGDYDGKNFQVLGYYDSLAELEAAVTEPERGDAYGIGAEAPYDVYVYDGVNAQWVNNGSIQGAQGETGASGATYTPHVAENGTLSWTNDKGLENPAAFNIIGPQGIQGESGADGASPFEVATEEGFTGTEATFNWALANIASHAACHAAGGTDALPDASIATAMLASKAVTEGKLADNAVSHRFTAAVTTTWTGTEAPYTQTVSVAGILATDTPTVDLVPSASFETAEAELDAWGLIYDVQTADESITLYATEEPESAFNIQMEVHRK